jgi:hypothetical protein
VQYSSLQCRLLRYIQLLLCLANIPASGHCFGTSMATTKVRIYQYIFGIPQVSQWRESTVLWHFRGHLIQIHLIVGIKRSLAIESIKDKCQNFIQGFAISVGHHSKVVDIWPMEEKLPEQTCLDSTPALIPHACVILKYKVSNQGRSALH